MDWMKHPDHIVLNREEAIFKEMASTEALFDYRFWEGEAYFYCTFFQWLQTGVWHGKQAATCTVRDS